ncbi:hypothetical protein [Lentzea sp. NPDC092896]|uniref:hypothetical protein n=1 Tax=Lentzea sp. NPDC092896 TaxID=3364127 RepID=UPI00381DFF94
MTRAVPTLTLQDVADLARVRRPVVSTWRNRPRVRGKNLPFPEPVDVSGGIERFSRNDVVIWLERTRRGRNAEAHLDAPALSVPDDVPLDELVTWLCLAVMTGEELAETSAEQRVCIARAVDTDDQLLLREVVASTPATDTLQFVDDLIEASYGGSEALDRLEQGRAARTAATRGLTPEAVHLVQAVADACSLHIDPEGVPLVHVGGASATTLALAGTFAHVVVPGDGAEQRDIRRKATIRSIDTTTQVTSGGVRWLSVVGGEIDENLKRIDDLVLELGRHDLAVLLGPASLLCDELNGEHELNRAHTLRSNSLAAALRLPRGMWREAHRQALGLWVCTGEVTIERPLVADLGAFTSGELALDDLAADVTGALEAAEGRAFRYLRPHHLPLILSSRAPVVPRGVRAVQIATTEIERQVSVINSATLVTSEPIPTFDVLAEAAQGSMVVRRRSLAELKELGHLQMLRGSRINPGHADPVGSVAVLSAADAGDPLRLDPFDAMRWYPRAVRTDPGDVIFAERPRPLARVDVHGGSLVASPSRILRVSSRAGIGPHAVAAIINRLPDEVTEWQTWSVPVLNSSEAKRLENAVTAAREHEANLRRHLSATQDLITAMIAGVAAGAVTLTTQIEQ